MMIRLILLIGFIHFGSFYLYGSAKQYSFHWLFVHYHKTGHDLARSLGEIFVKEPCDVKVSSQTSRRTPISDNIHRIVKLDIAILAGPNIFVPWNETLLKTETDQVKIIHFLRDPFDMIISAYLYHAQEEAPKIEKWLFRSDFNPCAVDHHLMFNVFAREIGVSYGNYKHISDLINGTLGLCHELLQQNYDEKKEKGYHQQLRSLLPEKAILLEAARSILSKAGGDILRVATNALYERNTVNRQSYRVFLSDFPVGNLTQFIHSSSDMFQFLMADPADTHVPVPAGPYFWSCMNVSTAVDRAVQQAFVSNSNQKSSTGHITQDLVSRAERASLKKHLEQHPVLGELLRIVQDIVLEYRN